MKTRLGCTGGGITELKAHPWFAGFDWDALEDGRMPAPIQPNINDINAPSKKDIAPFVKPKDVTWDAADQAHFDRWEFMDPELQSAEAIYRIKKRNELVQPFAADGLKVVKETSGGGGCCSLM